MVIYYFRQPDNKKEEYMLYKNSSLTKIGEELVIWTYNYKYLIKELFRLNNVK